MFDVCEKEVVTPEDKKIPRAELEKYYTPEKMIKECTSLMERVLPQEKVRSIMDPCAGDGRWYWQLKSRFTEAQIHLFDLAPDPIAQPGLTVKKLDFLSEDAGIRPDVIATNPPFGKANSLSRAVFNRAVDLYRPEYICLLVPRSFSNRKSSLRRLRQGYTKIQETNLSNLHFERIDGKVYSDLTTSYMQCCFEIWQKNRVPLGEFKMEFAPGHTGNSRVKFARSEKYGFVLYRPQTNKLRFEETQRTEEKTVRENFETMLEYENIQNKLVTLITHGTRAGEVCKFNPDEDKASVKQFIFSPNPRIIEEIAKMKKGGGFQEYLGASGFSNNPSLGSEEIMECIEAWLDENLTQEAT